MDEANLIYYTSQSLILVLLLSLPTVAIAAIVGLLVGLFQGLTQIQDQTISFAFRLVAVVLTIVLTARWLGIELHNFTLNMFNAISLS